MPELPIEKLIHEMRVEIVRNYIKSTRQQIRQANREAADLEYTADLIQAALIVPFLADDLPIGRVENDEVDAPIGKSSERLQCIACQDSADGKVRRIEWVDDDICHRLLWRIISLTRVGAGPVGAWLSLARNGRVIQHHESDFLSVRVEVFVCALPSNTGCASPCSTHHRELVINPPISPTSRLAESLRLSNPRAEYSLPSGTPRPPPQNGLRLRHLYLRERSARHPIGRSTTSIKPSGPRSHTLDDL